MWADTPTAVRFRVNILFALNILLAPTVINHSNHPIGEDQLDLLLHCPPMASFLPGDAQSCSGVPWATFYWATRFFRVVLGSVDIGTGANIRWGKVVLYQLKFVKNLNLCIAYFCVH